MFETNPSKELPTFTFAAKGPDVDGDAFDFHRDATGSVATVVHEYVHIAAAYRKWKFQSRAVEETAAYLYDHAAAVDMGMTHAPTPRSVIKDLTPEVWAIGNSRASELAASRQGARLAFTIVKSLDKCDRSPDAIRGFTNLLSDEIESQREITIATLRKLHDLDCQVLESAATSQQKTRSWRSKPVPP